MNTTQFIERYIKKSRSVRWLAEKDALDNISNFYLCKQGARFLDLGCGTRAQGFRHEHEEHFVPNTIECMVKFGWKNPVGVDIAPQATNPVDWIFIQGDLTAQSTWDSIGTGFDVINLEFVISFQNTKHISPSILPHETNPYHLAMSWQDRSNPLQYTQYFQLVDTLFSRTHNALVEGGVVRVHDLVIGREGEMYKPLLGFHYDSNAEGDKLVQRLSSYPWKVKWKI